MKYTWPAIGPFTSLQSDLQQLFESHGIEITGYNVQPRHSDSGADQLWTIEGRNLTSREQRDKIREDGEKHAVITFPIESHEEFEQLRQAEKRPDETWYFVNNQREIVSELDSPIQKLEKLASTDQKQSAEEARELVKEALKELQTVREQRRLHTDQPRNPGKESSSEELVDQAGTGTETVR